MKSSKQKRTKIKKAKIEKSVNKPKKSSKHFRHENLIEENFNPKNGYYKRNKVNA